MHCVTFSSHDLALLEVGSITSPKIWVELWVLMQKCLISFFKKATELGHLWINWGPSKCARIDPSNSEKTEARQELWEPCQHPMCAHVWPPYLSSQGMLMGCKILLKEIHSPSRNQGNVSLSAHTDPQLGYGVWPQVQESGKTWPDLTMQELQNTWPILHLSYKRGFNQY